MHKPILFSTPMVKAILAGNKTHTRREKGLEFLNENPDEWTSLESAISENGDIYILLKDKKGKIAVYSKSPYGRIGDCLWVRETWTLFVTTFINEQEYPMYFYKADYPTKLVGKKWKPSIHMPRKASRITLEIIDIRIERLWDITEKEAIREGVEIVSNMQDGSIDFQYPYSYLARDYLDGDPTACVDTARDSFFSLWKKINGIESFEKNPWVWVIVFSRNNYQLASFSMEIRKE